MRRKMNGLRSQNDRIQNMLSSYESFRKRGCTNVDALFYFYDDMAASIGAMHKKIEGLCKEIYEKRT